MATLQLPANNLANLANLPPGTKLYLTTNSKNPSGKGKLLLIPQGAILRASGASERPNTFLPPFLITKILCRLFIAAALFYSPFRVLLSDMLLLSFWRDCVGTISVPCPLTQIYICNKAAIIDLSSDRSTIRHRCIDFFFISPNHSIFSWVIKFCSLFFCVQHIVFYELLFFF